LKGGEYAHYRRAGAGIFDPSARLELRVPVVWAPVGTTVRARMGLHNAHALPLKLHAQVLILKPWKPTVFLMLQNVHLRRLDVNGSRGKPNRRSRSMG
jgi:hypothetical protein